MEEVLQSVNADLRKQIDLRGPVSSASISPDKSRIAIGYRRGRLLIWNALTKTLMSDRSAHREAVTAVEFSPNSKRLVTTGNDGFAGSGIGRETRSAHRCNIPGRYETSHSAGTVPCSQPATKKGKYAYGSRPTDYPSPIGWTIQVRSAPLRFIRTADAFAPDALTVRPVFGQSTRPTWFPLTAFICERKC